MSMQDTIAAIRKEAGITQAEMARRLHVTRQAVSRWETGETAPGIDMVKLICVTFGVPLERFFDMLGLKYLQDVIDNERAYGAEIRERFGDEVIDAANRKYVMADDAAHLQANELELAIKEQLRRAMEACNGDDVGSGAGSGAGSDTSESEAQRLVAMHKRWLTMYWPDGLYTPEMHKGLADGYLADARFQEYYEAVATGATRFLRDAIYEWADSLA